MVSLMRQIMGGEVSPVMIAAIITGLRVKKETIGEIAAAAQVMRELSTKVQVADADRISSIPAAPAATAPRPSTSRPPRCSSLPLPAPASPSMAGARFPQSGSADVLEALGVNINLTPEQVGRSASTKPASASCSPPITTAP
jgi:anthranilate phosphoribosyltransferase